MAVDYISLWNAQHEAANRQKQIFSDGKSFWEDPKNVSRFLDRLFDKDRARIENQLAMMRIPKESSVLDIGAGPGTLAVPLALAGCFVTAVEPSGEMRSAMQEYRKKMHAPEIQKIPCRWEDVDASELGTYDFVIASLSLGLDDIGPSLLKMDAAARNAVHLFWFLSPPSWSEVNAALWPKLHGAEFVTEPRADLLWGCLCQLGIYPNLFVEHVKKERRCAEADEIISHYCRRLCIREEWQQEIAAAYLRDHIAGLPTSGVSKTAHIWWEKDLHR
ncbi:class I SAM-dependent methyltransferase [Methanorbis rubei]|uniref:Methyltransferase domain-containing protein n=1 Tax=Methanorbis rubei TaxID=3028300 RepID=A0AAE4MFJ5_9EURY|nr:hypothetical protein [Methanocorpusculaceae archaeon Cs1]